MHVVGTAGHVDHGKSTLVHALTGIDPDRFEEEKRRGLTIDLGFAWFTLPSGRDVGIVDVPGHERFIRNMLAGAGAVELALFVVAVDEGWKPQSEEHLQILDLLGVSGGVVALTKIDRVDAAAIDTTRDAIWQRIRGTCLHEAAIIGVSATTGAGMDDLRSALDELLDGAPGHTDEGRPRMFVDRSFTVAGAGTVVTGTLAGGRLRVGDEIELMPSGDRARIRSLQTHKRSVDEAVPTSRVAINLVGLQRADVERGDAVVLPDAWRATTRIAVTLAPLEKLDHAFTERGAYQLYAGSAETSCRLRFLEEASDAIVAVNIDGHLVSGIRPGYSVLAEIFCDRELTLQIGDRFVLRDAGRQITVAGGIVLDTEPGSIRRGDETRLKLLHARNGLRGAELAHQIVAERGVIGRDELRRLTGTALSDEPFEVDPDLGSALATQAREVVTRHHETHPLDVGIPRDTLRETLGVEPGAFSYLLASWDGIVVEGNAVRLTDRKPALPSEDRARADTALDTLRAGGASPLPLRDAGLDVSLAKALERSGELVLITPEIGYPADVWDQMRQRIVAFITEHGPAPTSALREALETSRKYAIPVLERLDATKVTRRRGDLRELV